MYDCYVIVRTCTFYNKMYTLFNIYIILMYHYIPVGHQDECNINRGTFDPWDSCDIYWQSLRINGMTVESVGRR